jgi:hypothetical protein
MYRSVSRFFFQQGYVRLRPSSAHVVDETNVSSVTVAAFVRMSRPLVRVDKGGAR